jgi:dihydroneopterin aldolase
MDKLEITGMEFFAGIGCYKEEKLVGTKFIVDLEITLDCSLPADNDNINDALNYVNVYNLVKNEMTLNCNLIENAAKRILKKLTNYSKAIIELKVRLSKINPTIGGKLEKVTIEMTSKNEI